MALDQSEASILGHCGWFNMGKIGLRSLVITPCPYTTDVVLVDASQLLYHVVWPVAGTAGDLALSIGVRLSSYRPEAKITGAV